mmetsp:Transcript_27193/g.63295  ORF Transcript_27193/g.63295 Transcript_27193/m.63295 type:complete len:518 (-) Transcript_27193:101-1654(-)
MKCNLASLGGSKACLILSYFLALQLQLAQALLVHSDEHVVAVAHQVQELELKAELETGLTLNAALLAEPGHHPWWQLDWSIIKEDPRPVLICCLVLLLSGVLCAAGGIGGGGIYVSLLMMAGGLSAHDAVPLSKAVVFLGALVTLIQNLSKGESSGQSMIDYNACSLIVPSALSGTLLGVFINRLVVEWVLVLLIVVVLVLMSFATGKEAYKQYIQAQELLAAEAATDSTATSEECPEAGGANSRDSSNNSRGSHASGTSVTLLPQEVTRKIRKEILVQEIVVSMTLLIVVILCGAIHYRLSECQRGLRQERIVQWQDEDACNHPLLNFMFSRSVYTWMNDQTWANVALVLSLLIPLSLCSTAAVWCSWNCVRAHSWSVRDVMLYCGTAISTGLLAGLVGIGGGLIFSPFLLLMGMQPSVAVATSSTCVLFTSCSTAMQYLLSDRVVVSLCLVYGTVNIVASYFGTLFVHNLQDRSAAGKWRISATVLAGVVISVLFCLAKFRMLMLAHGQQSVAAH